MKFQLQIRLLLNFKVNKNYNLCDETTKEEDESLRQKHLNKTTFHKASNNVVKKSRTDDI